MKRAAVCAVTMAAALVCGPGDGNVVRADVLEEVIVTAQKRQQNVQDVSIAVNAFTGDQLRELGVLTAKDIADYTAGVQINMEYGNAPTFTIRGINVNDFYVTTTPTAAVYVDGVYRATSINSGPQMFDIERIEILKGPQGTLYGRNTTGGAVSIVTKKPTDEREAYFEASYGSFDRTVLEGALSGPLTDNLKGRLAFQWQRDDGAYDNVTFPGQPAPAPILLNPRLTPPPKGTLSDRESSLGDLDYKSFRAQLMWTPNAATEVLLNAHYTLDDSMNPPVTILGAGGPSCGVVVDPVSGVPTGGSYSPATCTDALGFSDPDPFDEDVSNDYTPEKDNEIYGASVTVNWDTDFGRLVSITAYEGFDRFSGIDADGTANQLLSGRYSQEHNQYSQELRLEIDQDRWFHTLGLYVSYDEIKSDEGDFSLKGPLGLFPLNSFINYVDAETFHASIFGHSEWQFADQWRLIGGLRVSYEEKDNTHYDQLGFVPGTTPFPVIQPLGEQGMVSATSYAPGAPDHRSSTDVSYRFALEWTPRDELLLYASHSRGVKSGGFDNTILFTQVALTEFDEEILKAYELGMKWDPTDTLRLNAAMFYYDYERPQQRKGVIVNNVPQQLLVNVEEAEMLGAELEIGWNPLQGLDFLATASFYDSETSDSVDPLVDDNNLPFAPDQAFTLLGRYEWPILDSMYAAVQANVNYTGDHYPDAFNVFMEEQDYTLVGARLAVGDNAGKWEASFSGRNLTDEFYIINSFAAIGARGFYLNEPRTFSLTFRYNFF